MTIQNKPYSPIAPFREVLTFVSFRHLWFSQFASQLALNALIFVLGIRVYQTTGSNAAVSVLFLVYGLASVLFGMAGGTIVDKLDKRFVLVFCNLSRAFIVFAYYFISHNPLVVYILTFLNAVITQLYVPAEAPTIPRYVPEEHLVTANSLFSFTYFTSLALGSIFAGPILRVFGPTGVFFTLSILFLIAGYHAWQLPRESSTSDAFTRIRNMTPLYIIQRIIANTREGVEYVLESRSLREALLLLAGTQVILAVLSTLGPGFADKLLRIDIRDSSLIITGPVVIGIILGALWVGSVGNRFTNEWLIEKGILSAGFTLILVAIISYLKNIAALQGVFDKGVMLVIILILFFCLGVANSLLDVPSNSILQKKSGGVMTGRVYGILTAAVGGIGILPVILGGLLADFAGVGKVILAMGILVFVYGLFQVRYNHTHPSL